MKHAQKVSTTIVFVMLVLPQITFAAWWNPSSWGLFSFIFGHQQQEQLVSTTTQNQTHTDLSTTTLMIVSESTTAVATTSAPAKKKIVLPPKAEIQTPRSTEPVGVLCNGTYWNACPAGQNLVCPQSGDASCQVPQTPLQTNSVSQNHPATSSPKIPPVVSMVIKTGTLETNKQGTWAINAEDPQNNLLSYYVNWGDENSQSYGNVGSANVFSCTHTTNVTYTHSYYNAGTYFPKFTVVECVYDPSTNAYSDTYLNTQVNTVVNVVTAETITP